MRLSRQKRQLTEIQDGGGRHLKFRKTVAISLLFDQSFPNLTWIWRIRHRMQLKCQKRTFIKIQDGGCHHIGFQKTVTISLLFDQSLPNLMEMANTIWNVTKISKMQSYENSRWRLSPS